MALSRTPRLGVVVPPENPTAEPEFNRLVGDRMNVFAARFPVTPDLGLRDMLETYNTVLPETLAGFGAMRLDAAVVACSASHYLLSPDGDRRFCAELTERAGCPVLSSTQAILAACEALGLTRLTLVSPYESWLTDTSRAFWEEAGLTVVRTVQVPAGERAGEIAGGRPGEQAQERFNPYEVTTEAILERVRGQVPADDCALLFTGTGMYTLAALDELAQETGRVLLTSNLACAWWALHTVGARPGEGGHPLLRRLAHRMNTAGARAA
ncbi:arylmalonate decarboxylase [Streptomyces sp. NBC_01275]|uniref:maleate cis-trans isomerase family protein n=1 Tax=Streptomyces sp. NBC_01275 TaxID=2903807 RepID=UPI002253C55A|nr:arylmalonate decarboxylase [Streptomyces sp. NBC_01275]MCX4761531.1 arylmalonate decarboxylase [Streptomyces sp. NBC_01275]